MPPLLLSQEGTKQIFPYKRGIRDFRVSDFVFIHEKKFFLPFGCFGLLGDFVFWVILSLGDLLTGLFALEWVILSFR